MNILNLFNVYIIQRKLPLSFVLNKFFRNDPKNWMKFVQLYNLWIQVSESYSEINSRAFILRSIKDQADKMLRFKKDFSNLLSLIDDDFKKKLQGPNYDRFASVINKNIKNMSIGEAAYSQAADYRDEMIRIRKDVRELKIQLKEMNEYAALSILQII